MLCAYVLQCGCVQCINDYGFVRCLSVFIFPCIGGSLGPVCEASVSFFSARRVYFCFILDINIALIFFLRVLSAKGSCCCGGFHCSPYVWQESALIVKHKAQRKASKVEG